MFIVDAHQDIAYNAICFGRDYRLAALRKRQLEAGTNIPSQNGYATIGLPESIVGRVAIIFATIFVAPYRRGGSQWEAVMYKDARGAYDLARQQLDYYYRLVDSTERIRLIQSASDMDAVLETWETGKPIQDRQQGIVLLMENADPILEPKQLEEWVERGLRIVGPAWSASRYSGGTGISGPLTTLGYELLETMADLNVMLDVSHMAEQAFYQALDEYEGTVIASHSNPRKFCDTDRHLSDDMIRRLAERDGVMGIVPYNQFLKTTWSKGSRKATMPRSIIIDVIDHVCQVTGSATHVGIGTDFDGGFGAESIPQDMDTIADIWYIGDLLRERGYDETDISAILGGNMLRKLREILS